jgi:hypothetical protein
MRLYISQEDIDKGTDAIKHSGSPIYSCCPIAQSIRRRFAYAKCNVTRKVILINGSPFYNTQSSIGFLNDFDFLGKATPRHINLTTNKKRGFEINEGTDTYKTCE